MSITTLNTYEMVFLFADRLKRQALSYQESIEVQTTWKKYQNFVKKIKSEQIKDEALKKKSLMKRMMS